MERAWGQISRTVVCSMSLHGQETPQLPIVDALLSAHLNLSIVISVIYQLDAQNFCFTISLFHASTCFEHHVLIIRRSKLYYTAPPLTCFSVTIPKAVEYNFDLLMMSTWYSKHVEAWNKLIVKQKCCASSWLITKKTNYIYPSIENTI